MNNNIDDNLTVLNYTTQLLNNSTLKETQKEIDQLNTDMDGIKIEMSNERQDDFKIKSIDQISDENKFVNDISEFSSNRQTGISISTPIQKQSPQKEQIETVSDQIDLFKDLHIQNSYNYIHSQNDDPQTTTFDESNYFTQQFDKKCKAIHEKKKSRQFISKHQMNKKLSMNEFLSKDKSSFFNQMQSEVEYNNQIKKKTSLIQSNVMSQTGHLNTHTEFQLNDNNRNKLNPQHLQSYKNIDRKQNDSFEQLFNFKSNAASKIQDFEDFYDFSETTQFEECSMQDLTQYLLNSSQYYTKENNSIQMESIKRQLYQKAIKDLLFLKKSKHEQLLQYLAEINYNYSDSKVISHVRSHFLQKIKIQKLINF